MAKSLEELKNNINKDINQASSREIDEIYYSLKSVAKRFDRDSNLKNLFDVFKIIFKTKRDKCISFVDDIFDSIGKLSTDEKNNLRKALLDISNIHRSIIENIIALLGAT